MSTNGRIVHCEVNLLAGQKKATNGKAGLSAPVFDSVKAISLLALGEEFGPFRFLLCLLVDDEADIVAVILSSKCEVLRRLINKIKSRIASSVARVRSRDSRVFDKASISVLGCSSSTLRASPPAAPARNFPELNSNFSQQPPSNTITFSDRRILVNYSLIQKHTATANHSVGSFRGLSGFDLIVTEG